ncbi:histone-lysine N-methyltransferase ASHR1 isoform X3 [Neltuma alba]|uniref:histone-lysine N-methyltransferase ASHR1 isoform X3 n=1 Tax=Neltuma alba TaxID=207710 RepID=UPI0010A3C208|nr:histone-lysine N-methyltransferase ASHR1-like isoform X3 [Prosopis alba]
MRETPAMEDLQSALKDRNLTVSTVADKGRCLLATRDFYPGDVIISQEPYVCAPNNSSAETRCDGCFATSKLKKCSGCQVVWYCGSTCQRAEWKLHRLECEVLSRLEKDKRKFVTPSIRLMVIPSTATDNYSLVEALVAHMSDINEGQLVLYAQMANLVNLILQWPEINIKEIAENFSRFACNAHTICDSELRPLGTGLYPVISIINHSCLPNSVLVFEGRSAVVRAVQHIPKGSEVLISYIETAGSTMTRQKALKEQYLFTCTCPRCARMGQSDDIRESAILEGYRCKNEKCYGFLMRTNDGRGFQCQECGLVRDMEEIKLIATEVKSLTEDKASKLDPTGNYQDAVAAYKIIEKLQSELCHPFSISLMQTREKLLKLLMEVEHWREALAYCKLTLPVYQNLKPPALIQFELQNPHMLLMSSPGLSILLQSLSSSSSIAWFAILYLWKA